jgi:anaerobic selenocysteine-containing dehydrogenase
MVCVDIYRNATAELADWVLPACDMLERDDLNTIGFGIAQRPYVQYTPAVVEPAHERKSEWWICQRLLQEAERRSALDAPEPDRWAGWRKLLKRSVQIDLSELQRQPQVRLLPELRAETFFETQLRTADRKVDCCPPTFADALARAHAIFDELQREPESEPAALKLINRRDAWMMNSWLQNVERMHRGGRMTNPLYMNPDDARSRGLEEGSEVRVWNTHGTIEAVAALDADLRPGVVAMAHGWGNASTTGMNVARANAGANCNALLPCGPGSFEQLSGQAHMTGVPVEVEPILVAEPRGVGT